MKTYSVLIKAFATVVLRAETEEQALEIACEETRFGDLQVSESVVERELTTPEDIAQAKRHADKVVKGVA